MSLAAVQDRISEHEITPRISYVELSSSHLDSIADGDLAESGERLTARALPDRRARRGRRIQAMTSLAVFAALGVVGHLEQSRGIVTRFAARMFDTSRPSSAAVAAAVAPHVVGCSLTAPPRSIARRALASTGIELAIEGSRVALGFASSPLEGTAMELDPRSLSTLALARLTTTRPLRAIVPLLAPTGGVDAIAAPDAPHVALQKLEGRAPIEALRTVPMGDGKSLAATFRRDGTIWVGAISADALDGPPLPISDPKTLVGRPSLAVLGDTVVVAWASRVSATQPWSVRWTRWHVASGFVEASRALAIPDGGVGGATMSPSIAALGRDTFLVAWTEGASLHQVRAQAFDLDGARIGAPLAISPPSANAGQGEIALGADGRGLAAFLVKGESSEMELFAAAMSCD